MKHKSVSVKARTRTGSVLALAILTMAFVVLPAGIMLNNLCLLLSMQARYHSCVESASLLVADRISKIVVNDPHFGFISLSNQPPIGKATLAGDGEPCPVSSINNLLATVRLDTIIADKLNDDNMRALAAADYEQTKSTLALLQSSLISAIDPANKGRCIDDDGHRITPYADAQSFLAKNLNSGDHGHPAKIRNLRISLGWLRQGGPTNTPCPGPVKEGDSGSDWPLGRKYTSCIDTPVFGKSFIFAPVAAAPALVDEISFADADGVRFCSAVKVEADISYQDLDFCHARPEVEKWLHVAACAVPADSAQAGPPGALLVFFPCGPLADVTSLSDLLRADVNNEQPRQFYQAVNGDVPVDAEASTAATTLGPWGQQNITSARVIANGLYCWLRAAGVRPRIDSTVNALNQEFSRSLISSNLLYEFDANGNVVITSLPVMPLPISVVSDQQLFVETSFQNHSISCYNNVYNLGTICGGKHAGQPLEGNPINWCDLPYFGLSADLARNEGKGAATGLSTNNSIQVDSQIPGAVLKDVAEFTVYGKAVAAKPRMSYYSGGLAVEFSISGI
jgi:hypothetical protein